MGDWMRGQLPQLWLDLCLGRHYVVLSWRLLFLSSSSFGNGKGQHGTRSCRENHCCDLLFITLKRRPYICFDCCLLSPFLLDKTMSQTLPPLCVNLLQNWYYLQFHRQTPTRAMTTRRTPCTLLNPVSLPLQLSLFICFDLICWKLIALLVLHVYQLAISALHPCCIGILEREAGGMITMYSKPCVRLVFMFLTASHSSQRYSHITMAVSVSVIVVIIFSPVVRRSGKRFPYRPRS